MLANWKIVVEGVRFFREHFITWFTTNWRVLSSNVHDLQLIKESCHPMCPICFATDADSLGLHFNQNEETLRICLLRPMTDSRQSKEEIKIVTFLKRGIDSLKKNGFYRRKGWKMTMLILKFPGTGEEAQTSYMRSESTPRDVLIQAKSSQPYKTMPYRSP